VKLRVPFGQPTIEQAEIDEVVDTLKSGWIVSGPKVRRFEADFERFADVEHAVAVNSCTSALQLCMLSAGIGPGDEVITTSLTFAATVNSICHTGATPVFADIDPTTLNVAPKLVEERITARTRAVLPVHLLGRPADLTSLTGIADRHGLRVFADGAHTVEAEHGGRHVAQWGSATALSFQATKNVTTGEGGMVLTSDAELARQVRILRSHGLDKDAWNRYAAPQDSSYDVVRPGFKYSMSDIAASIGIHQLRRVERNLLIRARLAARYDEAFAGMPELALPSLAAVPPGDRHAYHLYTVLLQVELLDIDRDSFADELRGLGIGCGVHYRAVHLQKYYRERFAFQRGDFPAAEYVSDRTLSLPLSPAMTDDDATQVIEAVAHLIASHRQR
jgi:dTDP-4-amino-4,6-dideoxygalactose transaminase